MFRVSFGRTYEISLDFKSAAEVIAAIRVGRILAPRDWPLPRVEGQERMSLEERRQLDEALW